MKKYNSNHQFYQSVFDEIHASDKLKMKVQNMTNNKTKKKTYAIRKVICVAAAITAMLIAGNAIAYATTGETLIEHMVTANVDGQDCDAKLIDKYDEKGNLAAQGIFFDRGNGVKEGLVFEADESNKIDPSQKFEVVFADSTKPSIVKENDKVFLNWDFLDIHEDITEDFKDGTAEFTYKPEDAQDDSEINFTVTGTTEKNKIVLSSDGDITEYTSD